MMNELEATLARVEESRSLVARDHKYVSRLADELDDLVNVLGSLGRPSEAVRAAEEAAAIRRELGDTPLDTASPGLASSLNNLASAFGSLGRSSEALRAAEEAVTIYRQLAQASPDAFAPASPPARRTRPANGGLLRLPLLCRAAP